MYTHLSMIFNQLLDLIPWNDFNQIVGQHKSDRYKKRFNTKNLLTVMLYAQVTGKDSLRDIETGLSVNENKLYHLGIKSIAKSTIAYSNNNTNPIIFEKLFYALLKECKKFDFENKFNFDNKLYSIDATVIDLCLNLFEWAKYRKTKGAIKMHVTIENKSMLPQLITITEGNIHESKEANKINYKQFDKGSIFVIDRGYLDFSLLRKLNDLKHFFVIRTKKNTALVKYKKLKVNEPGIISDEFIHLLGSEGMKEFPNKLRLVTYYDKEQDKIYKFLTNNFDLSAKTIADIYKDRWQIEIFFKWLKQNLKIKSFLGTSKNAVLNQIWIAMIYYLILIFIKHKTKLNYSILKLSRMLRESIMYRISLIYLLGIPIKKISLVVGNNSPNELPLF